MPLKSVVDTLQRLHAAIYDTAPVPEAEGPSCIRAVRISYLVSFEDTQTIARYVYLKAARRGRSVAGPFASATTARPAFDTPSRRYAIALHDSAAPSHKGSASEQTT
jgi:hypothetical protein